MPTLIGGIGNREIPELSALSDFIMPRLNTISFESLLLPLFCNRCNEQRRIARHWLNCLSPFIRQGIPLLNGSDRCDNSIARPRTKFRRRRNELYYHNRSSGDDSLILNLPAGLKYTNYFRTAPGVITTTCWRNNTATPRQRVTHNGAKPILRRRPSYLPAPFWYFGHPEVYIIILPAFGLISHVISASNASVLVTKAWFCPNQHRHSWFCVWAHHMFVIGMSIETRTYFPAPQW